MKFRAVLFLSLLLCFTVSFAASAWGQGTDLGTIRGTVTDASGAVIAGAEVSITDSLTNAVRQTRTNAQGAYEIFGLKSGTYTVAITAPGMTRTEIRGLVLKGSDIVGADAVLKVSASQESVVVAATLPSINTEDQTISQTISSVAVTELPRDSRDVYSFLYLNPNITQSGSDGSFKFIGAQSYGASFSLDGQRSNGGIFGEPTQSKPSLEAVGEVNILTSDFSAEYAGVANIRVTTKRGGDTYHGSAFYNNKNSALAAWTLDDLNGKADFSPSAFQSKYPNPYFNTNDLGGSFGGPVPLLKKTWFFMAYERDYDVSPVKFQSNTLPHPDLYTGDFSQIDPANRPPVPDSILSQMTTDEINNNTIDDGSGGRLFTTIPSRFLNPSVQQMIGTYFPKIGSGVPINPVNGRILGGFQTILPGRSTLDSGVLRVDHDFSENDHIYGVYDASAQTSATRAVVSPYTGLGLTQVDRKNNTLSLSYTHAFSTSIINEVRGGFNREDLLQHSNTTLESFLSSIGFDQSDIDAYGAVTGPFALTTFGHPAVSFSNTFATFSNGGRNTFRPLNQNLITYGDTLTWIKGKHAFRMGGDMVYNQAQDGFALNRGNVRGSITYTGSGLTPFTSFLLGLPGASASTVSKPRPAMDVHNWESGFFFQDTWKLTPRITLNLGLRYELITPFIDKNDLIANFDPNFVDSSTGQLGRFVIPSQKTLEFLDPRIVNFGYVLAADSGLGVGRGVVRTDKKDWSPRVGIAWRIGDRSVVRGGYGIYYPTSAAQGIRDPIATNPFNQAVTKNNRTATPLMGWPGAAHGFSPITGGAVRATGNTPAVNVVPFDIHQPRIHQYNVTYEREIGWGSAVRFSYLGSTMHGLIAGKDLNQLEPTDTPFGTNLVDPDTGETIPDQFCDPVEDSSSCGITPAQFQLYRFPALGDFVLSYGNYGHAQSNAFQTQFEHHYANGLLLNLSYTYLDQKSTALDTGNSSLGGIAYNSLLPNDDYGIDGYVSKQRFVAYGVYDLPFGKRRQYGASLKGWEDAIVGGWSTTFNMFVKSGTGFTPFWICDNCNPIEPGNIGISSVDAVGDFNAEPSYRPTIVNSGYNNKTGDSIWNAMAFGPPSVGADIFSNPANAKRNLLWGPGTWGVNLGLHKDFHIGERIIAQLGADVDNLFNHPLLSPNSDDGGGGGSFALLGDFNIRVDPATGSLLPIQESDITRNDEFGQLLNSYSQEGVDRRRTVRLRLRITF